MKILCLQHVPFEKPGVIADWAIQRGHTLSILHLFAEDELPPAMDWDCMIILGGPMSVHDEQTFTWMLPEKQYIREAIAKDRCVIGICLGAQLIAEALGAQVYSNEFKEIGWHEIKWTDEARNISLFASLPKEQHVFHWHGETFDLPKGASLLASSVACRNQAFAYGENIFGFQFHLEMTAQTIHALVDNCGSELNEKAPFIQTLDEIKRGSVQHVSETSEWIMAILNQLEVKQ